MLLSYDRYYYSSSMTVSWIFVKGVRKYTLNCPYLLQAGLAGEGGSVGDGVELFCPPFYLQ
jgi:hypothetical protein